MLSKNLSAIAKESGLVQTESHFSLAGLGYCLTVLNWQKARLGTIDDKIKNNRIFLKEFIAKIIDYIDKHIYFCQNF